MRRFLTTWCTVALLPWLGVATASATPITPAAFGSLAQSESFEGLAPGADIALGLGQSLLEPGTVSAYAFASGVLLSSPVPNPGFDNGGAFVHDFALGTDVQNNWGGGRVVNDATDVPFGSAYLGAFAPGVGTTAVEFTFASAMDRVGAYVTGASGTNVAIEIYSGSGTLLETSTVGTVDVNQWGSNFLGLEDLSGIRRVVFRGVDFGIDQLTFEASPVTVPEPASLHALAFGLVGLLGLALIGRERVPSPGRPR